MALRRPQVNTYLFQLATDRPRHRESAWGDGKANAEDTTEAIPGNVRTVMWARQELVLAVPPRPLRSQRPVHSFHFSVCFCTFRDKDFKFYCKLFILFKFQLLHAKLLFMLSCIVFFPPIKTLKSNSGFVFFFILNCYYYTLITCSKL